VQSTGS